ncbi:MAG: glycyl-radical enzyme activating protein [Ruminococcaceae bacterium]|nr:glycyl-radical enzyme activating protein [Oscillospiraceae bacterium]
MLKIEGNIFDIQRFSVHDGPGIRTTVFFKGCPLNCIWCHNPESQAVSKSLAYYENKCVGCGACKEACPKDCHSVLKDGHVIDRDKCLLCSKCVEACPFGALEMFGKTATVSSIIEEVARDKTFYKNSGGGMTVSGGEPLMQGDFLVELLKKAKEEGIHTCIETSGFGAEKTVRAAAEYTDIFLFDIKATDDEKHRELTGVPFAPIKKNLLLLDSIGKSIVLRCPLVPGVNTDEEHIKEIAKLAVSLENVIEVNVMAYHTLGNGKYDALDMDNKMTGHAAMEKTEKEKYISAISEEIQKHGSKNIKVC